RLVADAALRARLGAAGRMRAVEQFRWERVIRAYEDLWAEQLRELAAANEIRNPKSEIRSDLGSDFGFRVSDFPSAGPARYPAPEVTFAGYPTAWLDDGSTVRADPGAEAGLDALLALPLATHVAERRCCDRARLAAV